MAHKNTRQRYLGYDDACEYVQRRGIRNRNHYWKWWEDAMPPLPKYPHVVYSNWQGWNHFLRDNKELKSFSTTRDRWKGVEWLPFWEAVRASHKLCKAEGITSRQLWLAWCKRNKLPDGIPASPDSVYPEFHEHGWLVWLGKTTSAKITTENNPVSVLVVHQVVGQPPNVVIPYVHKEGLSSVSSAVQSRENSLGTAYRAFEWESDKKPLVDKLFDKWGSRQMDGSYIVPNINQLLWDLSNILLFAQTKK